MDELRRPPRDRETFPDGRCRLILIGKTGCGKSTTGNTILGREKFKSQTGINSETDICDMGSVMRDDLCIMVMDTPGLADSKGRDDVIAMLITRSLLAVHPGPHAVILCIRCDNRFTEAEYNVFRALKDIFGAPMTSYLIVIFVGVDQLEINEVKFEEQLEKSGKLKSLLNEAGNRYILFNNHADKAKKEQQVNKLMMAVKSVVKQNGGQCFKHRVSRKISITMDHLIDVEMKQETQEGIQSLPLSSPESEEQATADTREKEKSTQDVPITLWQTSSHSQVQDMKQDLETLIQARRVKDCMKIFSCGPSEIDKTPMPAPSTELASPSTVTNRPEMTFAEKQFLVDKVIRKVVRHPEELSPAQQDELADASMSVGQKIKDGLSKFAVKAIDQCLLM